MNRICSSYFNLQKNHVVVLNLTIKSDAHSKLKCSPFCQFAIVLYFARFAATFGSVMALRRILPWQCCGELLISSWMDRHLSTWRNRKGAQRRHCRGLSLRSLKRYSWIGRHWPNRRRSARLQRICGLIHSLRRRGRNQAYPGTKQC